jgi:hypothetical protein
MMRLILWDFDFRCDATDNRYLQEGSTAKIPFSVLFDNPEILIIWHLKVV